MKKKKFLIYMLLLFLMLMAAAFLPWFFFSVQDSLRLSSTQVQTREGVEIEQLNIPYETSVAKRLGHFAAKTEGYFVTGTDYPYSAEEYAMLEELLYGDYMMNLVSLGVLPDSVLMGYDISGLKKYVVYNEELDNGVAFMTWYAALSLSGGDGLELLWDVKTGTVYCVRYRKGIEIPEKLEKETEEQNQAFAGFDNQREIYRKEVKEVTELSQAVYLFDELDYFFTDYYESDFWLLFNGITEDADGRYEVSEENTSGGNQDTWELVLYDREEEERISIMSGRHWSNGPMDIYQNEIAFPYGDNLLKFVVRETSDENSGELLFGIQELGALIPEFEEFGKL